MKSPAQHIKASQPGADAPMVMDELEQDLRAQIAALKSQLLRFETAWENISQGVCFFSADERLILHNRRYAEIYRLQPDALRPGLTLEEIVGQRLAAGMSPMADSDYLATARSINAGHASRTWNSLLSDGRTIQICHQPTPDGGWVATHEDITELIASRQILDERISLQALIDQVPDYLWVKDRKSRFVIVNKALAFDSGRGKTTDMQGLTDFDLHDSERAQGFMEAERKILNTGKPIIDEAEQVIDILGREKWLSSTKVPLRNGRNDIVGIIGIARDITARRRSDFFRSEQAQILEMIATSAPLEEILVALMRLMESQFEAISSSVMLLDKEGTLRVVAAPSLDPSYLSLIDGTIPGPRAGSCGTAVYRREPVIVTDILTDELWQDHLHLVAPFGYRSCWSMPIMSHQGAALGTFAFYSSSVRAPSEEEAGLIELATRITGIAIERKLAEEQIRFMASHDVLTGLPSRALLEDRLSRAVALANRRGHSVTVLFIDLDNFKLVNDTLGHGAGDELLTIVARRMVESISPEDTVVRLGGDEFVIVLADQPDDPALIAEGIQKIQSAIARPIQLGNHLLRPTASIGIASYPRDGQAPQALLANADAAMYRAKEFGSGNFRFYTSAFDMRAQEKLRLQGELQDAIARSEFRLLYQPQVGFPSRKVSAVEALIRWNRPGHGLVGPASFIPVAEETGLIAVIGDWVLNEACRQNKAWQEAGLRPIPVCVNVSARQFREISLVERVVSALSESGLDARFLELEVTESSIMQDANLAVDLMRQLQRLGVEIAIDDFGTGYSSLSALKNFPVARLKIDKSFIEHLADSPDDQAVVGAVISLGQKLHLSVVAEGVETEAQVAFLRGNKCDEMQGYYFSRPLPPDAVSGLLRADPSLPHTGPDG